VFGIFFCSYSTVFFPGKPFHLMVRSLSVKESSLPSPANPSFPPVVFFFSFPCDVDTALDIGLLLLTLACGCSGGVIGFDGL